jgi:DNA-binding NtrC family response regulator
MRLNATPAPKNRVLIIDDEASLLEVLAEHFTSLGYEAHTADEAEAAGALLANYQYSLVITDLALTSVGFRGFDILDRTWDLCDRPKVIVLTGHGEAELQVEATRKGVDAFIQKPVRLLRLSEVAAAVLGATA